MNSKLIKLLWLGTKATASGINCIYACLHDAWACFRGNLVLIKAPFNMKE